MEEQVSPGHCQLRDGEKELNAPGFRTPCRGTAGRGIVWLSNRRPAEDGKLISPTPPLCVFKRTEDDAQIITFPSSLLVHSLSFGSASKTIPPMPASSPPISKIHMASLPSAMLCSVEGISSAPHPQATRMATRASWSEGVTGRRESGGREVEGGAGDMSR